jgi:hypothetical protein
MRYLTATIAILFLAWSARTPVPAGDRDGQNLRVMFVETIERSARVVDRDGAKVGYVRLWSYAGPQNHRKFLEMLQADPLRGTDALVLSTCAAWPEAIRD